MKRFSEVFVLFLLPLIVLGCSLPQSGEPSTAASDSYCLHPNEAGYSVLLSAIHDSLQKIAP